MSNEYIPEVEQTFDLMDLKKDIESSTSNLDYTVMIDENGNSTRSEVTKFNTEDLNNISVLDEDSKVDTSKVEETPIDNSNFQVEVYKAAFEFIKEQGILQIPEEVTAVTEDTLEGILEYNRQLERYHALMDIKSRAGDDAIAELFDLVYNGGTIDDLNLAKEIISEEEKMKQFDVTNPEDQKNLIKLFYLQGLDDDNPAHKHRIKNIDAEVTTVMDRMEGEEVATEAKNYFLKQIKDEKIQIQKDLQAREQARKDAELKEAEFKQAWNAQFVNTLQGRQWSEQRKADIIKQFDYVTLTDGSTMTLWEYKWEKMWADPSMVQVFMNFFADFDENTLKFKTQNTTPTKQATKMILDIANNKNNNSNKSTAADIKPNNNKQPDISNLFKQW